MIRNLDETRLFKILTAFYRSQLTQAVPQWVKLMQKLPWSHPPADNEP